MSTETDCFDVVVVFDFVFDFVFAFDLLPLLTLPIVQDRKWIKKALLFEPNASGSVVAFFCLLFLARKQRKDVAVGPPPTCEHENTSNNNFS
jgi:hypothetical protein